jgi:hypothetical protein
MRPKEYQLALPLTVGDDETEGVTVDVMFSGCRALHFKEHARDGLAEITGRYVVCKMEIKIYADVGTAQVRGRRERGRLGE